MTNRSGFRRSVGARKVRPQTSKPPARIRKKVPNHRRRASTEVSMRLQRSTVPVKEKKDYLAPAILDEWACGTPFVHAVGSWISICAGRESESDADWKSAILRAGNPRYVIRSEVLQRFFES